MNIDTLYENFYKRKESAGLIDEVMKFLLTERDASHPKSETFTYDMIPTIPINELGWGALKTPEGGGKEVPVDPASRSALAQYLSNIGGGGHIKDKLQELNAFFAGDSQPAQTGPPAEQLRQTISYLIFYKTLTQIVTNFNASSAGFSFESFLAVLLDADTGKQIPATGAGEDTTIADIVLFQGSRPISVKLYKEGSLKVGGSYRQLIKDLTAEGAPPMEYVAVTKEVSGEGPEASGKLRFYSFNFTLKNVVALLALGTKNRDLLRIPAVFGDAETRAQIKKEGGLEAYLELPEKKFVDPKPLVSKFYKEVLVVAQDKGLPRTALGALKDGLEVVMDLETGQPTGEYDQRPFFGGFPKSVLLRAVGIVKGSGGPMDTVEISKAERNMAKAAIGELWTAATLAYKGERKGGGARAAALERLAYMNEKDSIDTLLALSAGDEPEIYRLALTKTSGVTGLTSETQFDLSKPQLETIGKYTIDKEATFRYGEMYLGLLEIGVANVQTMLDNSVNAFNTTIFEIFRDLKTLSVNLNSYIAGGLQDGKKAKVAQDAAADIATGTKEVASTD